MGEYNNVIGGVSTMVAQGFKPWWFGAKGTIDPTIIDESIEISPREAYKHALDWQVLERDVLVDVGIDDQPSKLVVDPDRKALIRSDTGAILGQVGNGYGVVQNDVLVDFVEAIKIVGDDVCVKSAGSLFDGKVVWMLAKLGEDRAFDGDEHVSKYLLAASSHDGSVKLCARPTQVRVECMNTFSWAMGKGYGNAVVALRHTSKVEDRLADARRAIEVAYSHHSALDLEIEELLATPFSRAQFASDMVPAIAGEKPVDNESKRTQSMWEKRRDGLWSAWARADQQNINGTAWGAVMAVNSYELWSQTVRGTGRLDRQALNAVQGDFPLTQRARQLVHA